MTNTIVVIGKRSVRKSEIPHLETVGKALAIRKRQLVTTPTEGVASIIAAAYAAAGGTPIYMTKTTYEDYTQSSDVIAFTDTKYQKQLDEVAPDWRSRDWLIVHNPKATEEVAAYLVQLLIEFDTPLDASA